MREKFSLSVEPAMFTVPGRTAGPAEKLKIRGAVMGMMPLILSDRYHLEVQNVLVTAADSLQCRVGRQPIEVDPSHGCMRPLENDVLCFLYVEVRGPQPIEHVREHARPIAMTDHQHVSGRRLSSEVHYVRHPARVLERPHDANG